MQISDLISIGKLGKYDPATNWIQFKPNQVFKPFLLKSNDVFLIFTDHRVRFVTISKKKKVDGKFYLSFQDDDIYPELVNEMNVQIQIPSDLIQKLSLDAQGFNPIDYKVVFEDKEIGEIIDYWDNSGQSVFVIDYLQEKEILVPHVDYFLVSIDKEKKVIIMKNIEELILL